MKQFIEVTTDGRRVYQNVNLISNLFEGTNAIYIQAVNEKDGYKIDQTYDEVKELIKQA